MIAEILEIVRSLHKMNQTRQEPRNALADLIEEINKKRPVAFAPGVFLPGRSVSEWLIENSMCSRRTSAMHDDACAGLYLSANTGARHSTSELQAEKLQARRPRPLLVNFFDKVGKGIPRLLASLIHFVQRPHNFKDLGDHILIGSDGLDGWMIIPSGSELVSYQIRSTSAKRPFPPWRTARLSLGSPNLICRY